MPGRPKFLVVLQAFRNVGETPALSYWLRLCRAVLLPFQGQTSVVVQFDVAVAA